jgi:hypothetical protein
MNVIAYSGTSTGNFFDDVSVFPFDEVIRKRCRFSDDYDVFDARRLQFVTIVSPARLEISPFRKSFEELSTSVGLRSSYRLTAFVGLKWIGSSGGLRE